MIKIIKLEKINGRLFENCEICGTKEELYSLRIEKSSTIKPLNLCKKHMEEVCEKLREWKEEVDK